METSSSAEDLDDAHATSNLPAANSSQSVPQVCLDIKCPRVFADSLASGLIDSSWMRGQLCSQDDSLTYLHVNQGNDPLPETPGD